MECLGCLVVLFFLFPTLKCTPRGHGGGRPQSSPKCGLRGVRISTRVRSELGCVERATVAGGVSSLVFECLFFDSRNCSLQACASLVTGKSPEEKCGVQENKACFLLLR